VRPEERAVLERAIGRVTEQAANADATDDVAMEPGKGQELIFRPSRHEVG
jgi:hypothetical protein